MGGATARSLSRAGLRVVAVADTTGPALRADDTTFATRPGAGGGSYAVDAGNQAGVRARRIVEAANLPVRADAEGAAALVADRLPVNADGYGWYGPGDRAATAAG